MTTLIRELIDVPEQVSKGDFVLKLTDGVERAAETVRSYVVTDQLVDCFKQALQLIQHAVAQKKSSAAYLHGSFGSGKSHFMAVLHLLLRGAPEARAIPALAPVIAEHDPWLQGKKFLLVPYHMIGATSMEAAIFGGYVARVQKLHPDAPLPAVYPAEPIFQNAERHREALGDERFFAGLNAQRPADDGWGDYAAAWDPGRYDRARTAPPGSDERASLLSDLIRAFFPAYQAVAAGNDEALVSLDDGLAALSRHAHSLGYDGLVLFLDELILWLASRMADPAFVNREGPKLAKLVESQVADRPAPIVSFVARQRDLRQLVGKHHPGAEQLAFADALDWWEGRFDRITLEDRNLPTIAEHRLLRPRDEACRQAIDRAFQETERIREDTMNVLLTREADRDLFRRVYPFSPAFVQTLVAVSSALQRERTALRMMLQLLVDQRDTLALGQVVPVGDLFDLVSEGSEAFSAELGRLFQDAKRLYQRKLLPLLEEQHGVRWEAIRAGEADPQKALHLGNDARLLKTLLLAALVPEVESLKAIDAPRLAALNHGTIRSLIPGREPQLVLQKVRTWAAEVGEIKLTGDDRNPQIGIQISGVDTDAILARAQNLDNQGNRQLLTRRLVFRSFGIEDEARHWTTFELVWKGTSREVDLVFGNVRTLTTASLTASPDRWKVIVDFPFDEGGHTPHDDLERLRRYQEQEEPTRTVCWLPSFLSRDAQAGLGTLVVLTHILQGERFSQYAGHLSPADRQTARQILESQKDALTQKMHRILEGAYGIGTPPPGSLDQGHDLEQRFRSLDPAFSPRPPVGANLREGLLHLLDQALTHQLPAHPNLGGEGEAPVKLSEARKVLREILRITDEGDRGRAEVEKKLRDLLRRIAEPLELGTMHESAFQRTPFWRQHFDRCHARDGGGWTVARLRAWIDEPEPRGLPRWAQDLLIIAFARETQRAFVRHGARVEVGLEKLADDLEIQEQRLPGAEVWARARKRAEAILGLTPSPLRNAHNTGRLAEAVRQELQALQAPVQRLLGRLEDAARTLDLEDADTPRLRAVRAASQLAAAALAAPDDTRIDAFARAPVPGNLQEIGRALRSAEAVATALERTRWELLQAAFGLKGPRQAEAQALRDRLVETLQRPELVQPLAPALEAAEAGAARLLARQPAAPPGDGPGDGPQDGEPGPGETREGRDALESHGPAVHVQSTSKDHSGPGKPGPGEPGPGKPGRQILQTLRREGLDPAKACAALEALVIELRQSRVTRVDLDCTVYRHREA